MRRPARPNLSPQPKETHRVRPWLFSLALLVLAFLVIARSDFRLFWQVNQIQLEVKITDYHERIEIFIDSGQGFEQDPPMFAYLLPSADFQSVPFTVPRGKIIRTLRLDPASQPREMIIKSLTLKSLFRRQQLDAADLFRVLEPDSDLTNLRVENDVLRATITGSESILLLKPDAAARLFPADQYARRLRFTFALLAFLMAIMVFFWARQDSRAWSQTLLARHNLILALILTFFFSVACFFTLRQLKFDLFYPFGTLKMEVLIPHDDRVEIFYDTGHDFRGEDSIAQNVQGSNQYQIIKFKLPAEILPENLRFDLGTHPAILRLKRIHFQTFYQTFDWSGADVTRLFVPISDVAEAKSLAKILKITTSGEDPYFVGNAELKSQLQRLRARRQALSRSAVAFWGMALTALFFFAAYSTSFLRLRIVPPLNARFWLVFFFVLFITLPVANGFLRFAYDIQSSEKRYLAPKPSFKLNTLFSFPRAYETYFNDHFEFRNLFVRWNSMLRVACLRTSPLPWVLIGKQGWWYLKSEAAFRESVINDFLGLTPFSETELHRIEKKLTAYQQWCQAHNIHLIFLVCPIKSSIYPEYLPFGLKQVRPVTRLDQLKARMAQNGGLEVLDVRPALMAAKQKRIVFLQKDVHWNAFGGFIGYQVLYQALARLYPGGTPLSEDEITVTYVRHKQVGFEYDLVGMLNLSGVFNDIVCDVSVPESYTSSQPFPHVLVLHDSMFHAIEPYFKKECKQFTYRHHNWKRFPYHQPAILDAQPQVVVFELTENALATLAE